MPNFSARSSERLASCHPDLIDLMEEVIKHIDITVLCGHRSVEEQAELYSKGMTKLDGSPGKTSKHNRSPSLAVDVAMYPIDWRDRERWIAMAYFIRGAASSMGIKVRLGADWDGNLRFSERFFDAPHIELVKDSDEQT